MSEVFNTNVEINGDEDVSQLTVKGHSTQTEPLQTWVTHTDIEVARVQADGRLQTGSIQTGGGVTGDAQVEVFRHEDDMSLVKRGLNITGAIKDALTSAVRWSVHELVLKGSGGIQALHNVLRVRLTNENTGTDNTNGSLLAAQIEVENQGFMPAATGLQIGITNQATGYIDGVKGLSIEIADLNTSGGITDAYAIHTTGGKTRLDDVLELHGNRETAPGAETEVAKIYVKDDGKLYARLGSGVEFLLSSAPVPESGDENKFLRGDSTWETPAGTGGATVTSVGLTPPSEMNVIGSPVTSSGNLELGWNSQGSNQVFAGPNGSSGAPTWRALVANDIPSIPASKITSGQVPLVRGGTNADLSGTGPGVLKQASTGANITVASLTTGDIPNLDASKITTGQLAAARGGTGIDLTAAGTGFLKHVSPSDNFLTVAALVEADIPALPATKITSGTLDAARLPNFVGDSGSGGTKGAVPAPAAGDAAAGKYLKADGTWADPGLPGANPALSNLASVAINQSLVSDTDNTDDLGSSAKKWREIFGHAATLEKRSSPSTPSSGDVTLYAKTDSRLYYKTDTGEEIGPLLGGRPFATPVVATKKQLRSSELLYSATLGSAGRFDFDNIPQTYDDLFIRLIARSTANATTDTGLLLLNGVASSGTDYHAQITGAQNNAAVATEVAIAVISITTGNTSPASAFTQHEMTIPNYTSTTYRKLAISKFGGHFAADAIYNASYVMIFETTNAITRVTLQPDGYSTDNFAIGSRMEIYGVKIIDVVTDVTGSGSAVFVATVSVSVADSTSETSLVGTGEGDATLPATFLTAGRTLRVKAAGFYSTDASSAGTLQFRVKLGSIPIVASAAFSATDGVSDGAWSLDADITCRTVGGSGTVFGQGYVRLWDGAAVAIAHQMIATSTSTIDTTASQAVGLTAQWGTADTDNTLTITNLLIEAVG